jgi:hypothetical protein
VIEDARRRHRARRRSIAVAVPVTALVVGVLAAVLGGGPPDSRLGFRPAPRRLAGAAGAGGRLPARIAPALPGGSYGWDVKVGVGGSCCTVPTRRNALAGETETRSWPGHEVVTFLSGPELAAFAYRGHRLPITVVPGHLPFGLRVVQVSITHTNPTQSSPPSPPSSAELTALGNRGNTLPQRLTVTAPSAGVRWWKRPEAPANGPCRLQAHGFRGLTPQWGHVASRILPYGEPIIGRAFFSCVDTEYYLHHWPLDAAILLDAQHPGRLPAPLPEMTRAPGSAGIFNTPGGWDGAITARRSRDAWIVVAGGSGITQRLELLRHLTATISLGAA